MRRNRKAVNAYKVIATKPLALHIGAAVFNLAEAQDEAERFFNAGWTVRIERITY